tara:strand:+ start:1071 stop:1889 length:819 start_codon:yes stop_codon:yes gene_type:complete
MGPRTALMFATGRFRWVRRLNRRLRGTRDHPSIVPDDNDFVSLPPADGNGAGGFTLEKDAILLGLELSEDAASQLLELAETADIYSLGQIEPAIHGLDRINAHNAASDRPVCLATIKSPELDALCSRIARNPGLLGRVRDYMGGIREINMRLEWSLVVDADYAWRERQNQTVTYHYDVFGYNFTYAFFYLTPTDKSSGGHELIRGSHLRKPAGTYLSSIQPDHDRLVDYYGADKVAIIEGPPRSGFIEDTSCFHRARPAETAPRLALQIRYA